MIRNWLALLADLLLPGRRARRSRRIAYERWEKYQADLVRARRTWR